jgi:hypothetical protein
VEDNSSSSVVGCWDSFQISKKEENYNNKADAYAKTKFNSFN